MSIQHEVSFTVTGKFEVFAPTEKVAREKVQRILDNAQREIEDALCTFVKTDITVCNKSNTKEPMSWNLQSLNMR